MNLGGFLEPLPDLMKGEYQYTRKPGTKAGPHAESRRDRRRIIAMLLLGGVILGCLIYLIVLK